MSILMEEITHLNDHLFHENKKLKAQAELDEQLILDLGKQLKKARETITRLEAELSEMRMRENSNTPTVQRPGTTLPNMHA